ncbi:Uncharacterised protein g8068 [Pycnogonum litorale]
MQLARTSHLLLSAIFINFIDPSSCYQPVKCRNDADCLNADKYCEKSVSTCYCKPDYIEIGSYGICYKKEPLGGWCYLDEQCTEKNSICSSDNACSCETGYVEYPEGCRKTVLSTYSIAGIIVGILIILLFAAVVVNKTCLASRRVANTTQRENDERTFQRTRANSDQYQSPNDPPPIYTVYRNHEPPPAYDQVDFSNLPPGYRK